MVKWGLSWPIRFLLSLTIPDCRSPKLSHLYPVTFVSSTLWIAALSYVASWMMTVVGMQITNHVYVRDIYDLIDI